MQVRVDRVREQPACPGGLTPVATRPLLVGSRLKVMPAPTSATDLLPRRVSRDGGRPLRILMVAARFLPDMGGIETHLDDGRSRCGTLLPHPTALNGHEVGLD